MPLDINYQTTNPRNVDKILEGAIEEIQAGAAGKVFTPAVTDAQRTGTVDATAALLACAAELTANGGGTFVVNGNLQCNSSIILPVNTNIEFTPGSSILTRAGGTFITNALFLINTNDGLNWVTQYPNIRGYARGVRVDNSANPGLVVGAIKTGVSLFIENISTTHCHFSVKTTGQYLDHFRVHGSMAAEPQGTDYVIELTQLGDGLSVRSSHVYTSSVGVVPKNVKLTSCMGGEIQGTIGGDIYLTHCRAIKFHGGHHETGTFTNDGSDCSIEDSMFWVGTTPSVRQVSNSGGERRSMSMKNVSCLIRRNVTDVAFTPFDLQVGTGYHTVVENCSRVWSTSNNGYQSEKFGIFVANSSGTTLTAWNNYSYILSRRGEIDSRQLVSSMSLVSPGTGTVALFNSTTTTNSCNWQAASGTYYYQAQLIYDATRRLGINSSSAEVSFTNTNGAAACPHFVVGPGMASRTQNCFLRMYRGTAAGLYDQYVDIPLLSMREITDRGDYCSGFPWIARTAAVVATVFDTLDLTVKGATVDATVATIPPTIGTWTVGDKLYNSAPAPSGFIGSVCTSPGTPGVHKTWGAISA